MIATKMKKSFSAQGLTEKPFLHYIKNRRRHYRIDGSPPEVYRLKM